MLSKRVFCWTQCCPKECILLDSALSRKSDLLDSALSESVLCLTQRCQKGCSTWIGTVQKSVLLYSPLSKRVFSAVQPEECSMLSKRVFSVVQKCIQLYSALFKRVFSLTQRCPKECFTWLSTVQKSVLLDSALSKSVLLDSLLSKKVFCLTRSYPKECSALSKRVISAVQKSVQRDSALLRR